MVGSSIVARVNAISVVDSVRTRIISGIVLAFAAVLWKRSSDGRLGSDGTF
jgi:hypothetical protein